MTAAATPTATRLLITLGNGPGAVRSVLLHPAGGGINAYLPIAARLAERGPVAAIRAAGLLPGERPHAGVAEMVDDYAPLLAPPRLRPNLLLGWSMGGVLAWELAARLAASGPPPAVVVIDSEARPAGASEDELAALRRLVLDQAENALGTPAGDEVVATADAHVRATVRHTVTARHDGPGLVLACGGDASARLADWGSLGARTRARLPGGHFDVFSADVLPVLLGHLDRFLDDVFPTTEVPA